MSPTPHTAKLEPERHKMPAAPTGLGRRRRKPQTPATVRRNERERNRVRHVNSCFSRLRQFVSTVGPNGVKRHVSASNKRLSKVETLRAAITYIRQLQATLCNQDGTDVERYAPHNYPQVTIVDLVEPGAKRMRQDAGPGLARIPELAPYISSSDDNNLDNSSSSDAGTGGSKATSKMPGALSPCSSVSSSNNFAGQHQPVGFHFSSTSIFQPPACSYYTYSPPVASVPTQPAYPVFQSGHLPAGFSCNQSPSPVNFHGVPQNYVHQAQPSAYCWPNNTFPAFYC